jgi:uncharacterized protein (TIGR02145 family)
MKNVIIIFSAVLFITAINACTLQEDPDPTNSGGAINVIGQTVQEQDVTNTPETKTTLEEVVDGGETRWETHWIANTDKIGIFSPQAKATKDGTPEANPAKNLAFTAQTSAKSSNFTGTMFWWDYVDYDFYSYYPYKSGDIERTAVPISLEWEQTQSASGNTAHIGALDFMVATSLEVAYQEAVNFTFNHVFAMIEFRITDSSGETSLSQVILQGENTLAFSSGTIDLTQTPVDDAYTIANQSGNSKYVSVMLESPIPLETGQAKSVYMMILPGTHAEGLLIQLNIDGVWRELSKSQPDGGFKRGKKYVVTLNTGGMSANVLTDSRDAKTYSYKFIGTQVWMTENLAYLPAVSAPASGSSTEPYYYVYDYEGTDPAAAKATTNYTTYDVLYNWPAAMNGAASSNSNPSGVQGVCPSGWHLPSDAEWTTLTDYLGGESVAGGKMKEAGTAHWRDPNTGATNESGFTALPGGYRNGRGTFYGIGVSGYWWSSTEDVTDIAWYRYLGDILSNVYRNNYFKEDGFSVRCLRDSD